MRLGPSDEARRPPVAEEGSPEGSRPQRTPETKLAGTGSMRTFPRSKSRCPGRPRGRRVCADRTQALRCTLEGPRTAGPDRTRDLRQGTRADEPSQADGVCSGRQAVSVPHRRRGMRARGRRPTRPSGRKPWRTAKQGRVRNPPLPPAERASGRPACSDLSRICSTTRDSNLLTWPHNTMPLSQVTLAATAGYEGVLPE